MEAAEVLPCSCTVTTTFSMGSFSLRALEAGGAEAVLELPLKFEGEAADREIQETCDVKKSMPSGLAPNTLGNKEEPKK